MSIVNQAVQNLEDHGVDVAIPSQVEKHSEVNSTSELMNSIGERRGLEAASYQFLTDRIDLYTPLAATNVVLNLDENQMETLNNVFENNRQHVIDELESIRRSREMGLSSEQLETIKMAKLKYQVATNDEIDNDETLREELSSSIRHEALKDIEHELVHTFHYQNVIDQEIEPLSEAYERFKKDVDTLGGEMSENDERDLREGIDALADLERAAAIKFIDDESYENIVGLAEEEYSKWRQEAAEIRQRYKQKEGEITEKVLSQLDPDASLEFQSLMDLADEGIMGRPPGTSIEEIIAELERENPEEYQMIKQQVEDPERVRETLIELDELYDEQSNELDPIVSKLSKTEQLVKDALIEEAELQGDFEEYLAPYSERLRKGSQVPKDFTEAFAQFWTAYREGWLEDSRDKIYQKLEGYDGIEGLEETMDDLLIHYDQAEGDQEERVKQVMSEQMEYLEQNYDVEIEA